STQYKVGLPEVSEGQMAARVKLCGPGLRAHRLGPATLAAVEGADHPHRVRVVRLPSPDPGNWLQRVITVPAAVLVVVTEREQGYLQGFGHLPGNVRLHGEHVGQHRVVHVRPHVARVRYPNELRRHPYSARAARRFVPADASLEDVVDPQVLADLGDRLSGL